MCAAMTHVISPLFITYRLSCTTLSHLYPSTDFTGSDHFNRSMRWHAKNNAEGAEFTLSDHGLYSCIRTQHAHMAKPGSNGKLAKDQCVVGTLPESR